MNIKCLFLIIVCQIAFIGHIHGQKWSLSAVKTRNDTIDIGKRNSPFTYSDTQSKIPSSSPTSMSITYKVSLTETMVVVISHCGSSLSDTYLHVFDASENLVGDNDDYYGEDQCSNSYYSYLKLQLSPGVYYIVSEGYGTKGNLVTNISGDIPYEPLAPSANQNYIITRTYTSEDGFDSKDVVQYYDGLGRPIEQVRVASTPERNDWVSYQEYDAFGRESKSWLPAIAPGNNGAFVDLAAFTNLSSAVYGNTVYNEAADAYPYSYPVYEASPLNRVVKQYGPGEAWQRTDSDHPVKISYKTNSSYEYRCIYYSISGDNLVKTDRMYGPWQLLVTEMIDEDGNRSVEMKDKSGRLLLTRQYGDSGTEHDTYYVYDDIGNLRYILPPATSYYSPTNQTYSPDNEAIRKWAYVYWYDSRKRMIAKQIPGCEPVYYIYDQADRLIFSQDGEQRLKGEWSFSIPDIFGRIVLSGICKNNLNHLADHLESVVVKAERTNIDDSYKGYAVSGVNLHTATVLTVNYYDDYSFMNLNRSLYADFGYETLDGYGTRYTGGYKGLLTGTITAVLNTDTRLLPTRLYSVSDYDYIIGGGKIDPVYLYSVLYYDYKGQLIQSQSSNHLDGREKEYFAYNFTGQPTKKKHVHSASGQNTQTEVYTYEYDHSGRLLTTKHQLNSDAEVVLAENTYDELGRLKTTQAAGKASLKQTYGYNIRSWLKSLSGQLFSERLYYNEVFGEGTGYYNGNIATMTQGWDSPYIGYNYFYDLFSRLTRARSFFIQNGNNSYIEAYDTYYGYDKNGNITYLNRMEDWGYIDELEMFYDGNHLSWTRELGDWLGYEWAEGGFVDYSPTQGSIYGGLYYEYNANGGLKKDPFKGAEYTYNYLNLLSHVSVPAIVGRIDYQHTATGKKLKAFYEWCPSYSLNPLENTGGKAMLEGSCTLSRRITDYAGNLIYENGNLKRILTENGYIENGLYYFYLKDHLGNNNMIADANGQGRQFNFYYPYGLTSTNESANLDKQPYKFGGKEYETMHGLNLYDFEARPYDPILGRFLTPDPLAEKCPWINPYAYCNNNPVNYIDPTGMSTHTDSLGHVVNVYDDGDLNVYRHNTWDPANYSKDNTSAGGELMGETEYWDEFSPIYAEQNEDGSLGQFTIQFGKSFDPIIERMHKEAQGMDLIDIATTSRPNGFFDIKKNYKDIGALLNGRYVSSRSAGNYLAGYNASGAKLEFLQLYVSGEKKAGLGTGISFTTFQKLAGALHVNESLSPSEMTTIVLIGKSYGPAPTYGEQPYQYRMSKKGWNHGKKK